MNWQRTKAAFLHRRIFVVFLFSIALPGAYMGYVGLRSVVQEQELQRGVLAQSLERTIGFEIDRIERKLEHLQENAARSLLATRASFLPAVMKDFASSHAWIEEGFVFDAHLNLRGPLPFAAKPPLGITPRIPEEDTRAKLEAAAQLELQGNHRTARLTFEQLLRGDMSLESRVVVNNLLARSAAATGDEEAARRAYMTINQIDSTFRVTHPIPYAAFASLEIIEDLVKQQRIDEALQQSLRFYDRLLNWYFRFSSDQHGYLLQKIHTQIAKLATSPDLVKSSRSTLAGLEEREWALARSLTRAIRIESWLHAREATLYTGDSANGIKHFSLDINGVFTPLTLIPVNKPANVRQWVAFVVRPATLERDVILPALQSGDWAKDFIVTQRRDTSDNLGRRELLTAKMHAMAALFPSWEIAVFPKTVSTVEFLGIRIPLVSIGFVSLVVVIILLGIFIIYRDIRREEELSSMKSDFISNVSHELKTPIAAIRMLADNLRENRVESTSRRMEYYQLISQEGARLSHLIENILDFSRIENQKKAFRFERYDLSLLVKETVCQFQSLMKERASTISLDVGQSLPGVVVDPDAIRLAIFNLLDNAAKYSGKDTPIVVRLCQIDDCLCIEVKDRGRGISTIDQKRIFEKFYRVSEKEGKKVPGSGIGLTLVKEIAHAHKGSVQVKSQLGVGSTFQILVPLRG